MLDEFIEYAPQLKRIRVNIMEQDAVDGILVPMHSNPEEKACTQVLLLSTSWNNLGKTP
jgi:hypothetical protein